MMVFSANLPLLRPLLSHMPVAMRFSNAHDDKYSKISGPLVMKPSQSHGTFAYSIMRDYTDPSKVRTTIAQGGSQNTQNTQNDFDFGVPTDRVGVRTEIVQCIELQDRMV